MTTYPTDTMSVEEAAARIGKNPATIRRWIKQGKFPAQRPTGIHGPIVIFRAEYDLFTRGEWVPKPTIGEEAA